MAHQYQYVHVEPVDTWRSIDVQYIVRYPAKMSWPEILDDVAKRYLRRGVCSDARIYTFKPMSGNTTKVGLCGGLWRDAKGQVCWGTTDHKHVSHLVKVNGCLTIVHGREL